MVYSLGYELLIFVVGLILPRIIILSYGDAINGLTQTITRLLSLINLIQAGAVGASIYQMYKPVAEDDFDTQSAIMYSSKRYFNRLGAIYFVASVAVAVFYGFYLQDEALSTIEIILSFIILALNGSLYFLFNARYDILFSAYQKRYILTVSSVAERVTYYVLLFLVVDGQLHFSFMYLALLLGGVVRVLVNSLYYRKLAKGKIDPNPQNKSYPIKDRKYLMMNSIGTEAVAAAPTVIVTTFVGLAYSSVYSIYAMIYISMKTIINSVQLSVSAIFGNLVAKGDDKAIAKVFDLLVFIFVIMGAFLASCTAFLLMPFVEIYTKDFDGANYIYPILGVFVTAYVAIFSLRMVYAFVSTVYGLFKEVCKITFICGMVCVLISLIATLLFGMPYVMVGMVLFHLAYTVVLLIMLKKRIAWFNFRKLWQRVFLLVLLPVVSYLLSVVFPISITSFTEWIVAAVLYAILVGLILLLYALLFERSAVRSLWRYVKNMFFSKRFKAKRNK